MIFSSFSSSFVALFMLPQGFPISWTTETYSGGLRLDFSSVDGTIFHFLMSAQSCTISASHRPRYASLYFQQLFPETDRTHEDRGDGLCASELFYLCRSREEIGISRSHEMGRERHLPQSRLIVIPVMTLLVSSSFSPFPSSQLAFRFFHVNILRGGRRS